MLLIRNPLYDTDTLPAALMRLLYNKPILSVKLQIG